MARYVLQRDAVLRERADDVNGGLLQFDAVARWLGGCPLAAQSFEQNMRPEAKPDRSLNLNPPVFGPGLF